MSVIMQATANSFLCGVPLRVMGGNVQYHLLKLNERMEAVLQGMTVVLWPCPVLGQIMLADCNQNRARLDASRATLAYPLYFMYYLCIINRSSMLWVRDLMEYEAIVPACGHNTLLWIDTDSRVVATTIQCTHVIQAESACLMSVECRVGAGLRGPGAASDWNGRCRCTPVSCMVSAVLMHVM